MKERGVMNNLAINRDVDNTLRTIDSSAYFNVERKQLYYDIYNENDRTTAGYGGNPTAIALDFLQ